MGEFEDFIKAKYPVDYESLKEKYPNVPIVEFYGDEQDVWNHQQSKIEQLEKEKQQALQEFSGLSRFADEDCIEDFEFLKGAVLSACARIEKALRGECE